MHPVEKIGFLPLKLQILNSIKGIGLGILSSIIIISLIEWVIGLLNIWNIIRGDFPTETYLLWGAVGLVVLISLIRITINKRRLFFWFAFLIPNILLPWYWLALRTTPM